MRRYQPPERGGAAWSGRRPSEKSARILGSDHVVAEPRPPELDEGRVLPAGRRGTPDTCMDRQQRGPGTGILQAGPGGPAERLGARGKAFVERTDPSAEGKNLRPGQVEPCGLTWHGHHVYRGGSDRRKGPRRWRCEAALRAALRIRRSARQRAPGTALSAFCTSSSRLRVGDGPRCDITNRLPSGEMSNSPL